MLPFASAAGHGVGRPAGDAAYVATGFMAQGGDTAISLGASLAGDTFVALMPNAVSILGGDGEWTYITLPSSGYRFAWKVLRAADIAGPLAFSSSGGDVAGFIVVRGPLRVSLRASGVGSTGGLTLTGFTKGGWCAGLLLMLYTPANSAIGGGYPPAGWTSRMAHGPVMGGGSNLPGGMCIATLLTAASYTNGTDVVAASSASGGFYGGVLEFLNY